MEAFNQVLVDALLEVGFVHSEPPELQLGSPLGITVRNKDKDGKPILQFFWSGPNARWITGTPFREVSLLASWDDFDIGES